MLDSKYLYIGLLILSLAYPIAQSFERRVQFFKNWKYLFPAILVMMFIFIPWDIAFTHYGIWWFNDDYLIGLKVFQLPIEEILFFVVVPYACIFLYEVLNYFIKKDLMRSMATWFYLPLAILLLILGTIHIKLIYTSVTFYSTAIALLLLVLFNPQWKGRFLLMYALSWIPFLLINGALTGNFTSAAVVNYNPQEFIGFRVTSIPIEDSIYSLLMLLIVVTVYEFLKNRDGSNTNMN